MILATRRRSVNSESTRAHVVNSFQEFYRCDSCRRIGWSVDHSPHLPLILTAIICKTPCAISSYFSSSLDMRSRFSILRNKLGRLKSFRWIEILSRYISRRCCILISSRRCNSKLSHSYDRGYNNPAIAVYTTFGRIYVYRSFAIS